MNTGLRGVLFVVSGPSGAGKTVLCNKIRERVPGIVYSISATSRAPRGREKDGVDYFFHSSAEMRTMIDTDQLAEWAEVHGNYYGTPRAFLEEQLRLGHPVLMNIDVQGARQIKRHFVDAVLVFIEPPSLAVLEARLRSRSQDADEVVRKRLANAVREMEHKGEYQYVLVNDDLTRAVGELERIVRHHMPSLDTLPK